MWLPRGFVEAPLKEMTQKISKTYAIDWFEEN